MCLPAFCLCEISVNIEQNHATNITPKEHDLTALLRGDPLSDKHKLILIRDGLSVKVNWTASILFSNL